MIAISINFFSNMIYFYSLHNCIYVEVYLFTSEIRGRENFFVKDYEKPLKNFIEIDTTHQTEQESLNKILNVYR